MQPAARRALTAGAFRTRWPVRSCPWAAAQTALSDGFARKTLLVPPRSPLCLATHVRQLWSWSSSPPPSSPPPSSPPPSPPPPDKERAAEPAQVQRPAGRAGGEEDESGRGAAAASDEGAKTRPESKDEEPPSLPDPVGVDLDKFGLYEVTETEGTGPDGDGYRAILGVHGPRSTWWGGGGDPRAAKGGVFAVIAADGAQFKVTHEDVFYTNRVPGEVNAQHVFDQVLLIGTLRWSLFGRPLIPGARVVATIEEQTRSQKTYTIKFKKRKGYFRRKGHRQNITRFRVDDIVYDVPQDPKRYCKHVIPYDPNKPPLPNTRRFI